MRYTSLLQPMFLQPTRRRAALLLFVLGCAAFAHTQTNEMEQVSVWVNPVHELVQKALERAASPLSVSFEVENRAGLAPADLQQIRKAIDQEFRSAKVKVVRMDSAVAEFKFVLARNVRGLLWMAQVKQGITEQLSMLEFPDPSATLAPRSTLFQLQRTLLLARPGVMLDVATGEDFLLVLGSEQISLYPRTDPKGSPAASALIAHAGPWPRDLRGRLFLSGDSFSVFLPGVRCSGTVRPSLTVQCAASDDPWPLLHPADGGPSAFFSSARNHFSGVLAGSMAGVSVPAFFAAARLGDSDGALWALAGTDGNTRLYIRMDQPARTVTSLGSDVAALRPNCGSGWQLLVTGDRDETAPDVLQAFEIRNRDATAVSDKVSFDGPVTALWSAADPGQAIAIVRNLGKEGYEAYSITVTCGR